MIRPFMLVLICCVVVSGCTDENNNTGSQEETIRARVVSIPYIGSAHYDSEKAFSVLVEVVEPASDKDNLLLCYTVEIVNLSPYTNAATIMHHAMVSGEIIELTGKYCHAPGAGGEKELFKIHTLSARGYVIDLTKNI
jgi:hypothetical protein